MWAILWWSSVRGSRLKTPKSVPSWWSVLAAFGSNKKQGKPCQTTTSKCLESQAFIIFPWHTLEMNCELRNAQPGYRDCFGCTSLHLAAHNCHKEDWRVTFVIDIQHLFMCSFFNIGPSHTDIYIYIYIERERDKFVFFDFIVLVIYIVYTT